jgi:hypothetical protein
MCPFQKTYNYLAEAVFFDYKHWPWMGATVPARMILNLVRLQATKLPFWRKEAVDLGTTRFRSTLPQQTGVALLCLTLWLP